MLPSSSPRIIKSYRLGLVDYDEAHALQARLQQARIADEISDTLLLLEHPPVLTLGRAAKRDHILWDASRLTKLGIAVHEIGRGGDVTYHGPGQLVAYPIFDLKPDRCDVRKYVRNLEEVMIQIAASYGFVAGRVEGKNGAWIRDAKVGAVGVRISRWVTMHGFALNVNTNLSHFDAIVPCGLFGSKVTSLAQLLGRNISMSEVQMRAEAQFESIFGQKIEPAGNSLPIF